VPWACLWLTSLWKASGGHITRSATYHPDFEQAVIRAADYFRPRGLREAITEKDYYDTETLRIIEQEASSQVTFKGGPSLSKGWG